jgi:hypothetical protein
MNDCEKMTPAIDNMYALRAETTDDCNKAHGESQLQRTCPKLSRRAPIVILLILLFMAYGCRGEWRFLRVVRFDDSVVLFEARRDMDARMLWCCGETRSCYTKWAWLESSSE